MMFAAGAAAPAVFAQTVFTFDSYFWLDRPQAECLARGNRAIRLALDREGMSADVFAVGGRGTIVEGENLNLTVNCIADHDDLFDPAAQRALLIVVASSTEERLARVIRNIVADCSEGAPCFIDALAGAPPEIAWYHSAQWLDAPGGTRFRVACPTMGDHVGSVWGTDFYARDSAICPAALHAGAIAAGTGGVVTVELAGAQGAYHGSASNGITSLTRDSAEASYRIVADGG